MALNPKQEKFCLEYQKDANAAQAAIRAGYSKKTARTIGQQLLTKLDVKNRIKELSTDIENKNIATAQEIQEFLTKQMRGEEVEECVVVEGVGDGRSQATTINKKITPKDQQKAAETLAKIKQLFNDTPQSPVNIVINAEYE